MRYPQILVYEADGRLAAFLKPEAEARKWSLREPRTLDSCMRLLQRSGPSVIVLKLGKDLVRELTVLERTSWLFPDASTVVVCETAPSAIADLAWDLGASFVLFPPLPRPELVTIVEGLLDAQRGLRLHLAGSECAEQIQSEEGDEA
jgi:hypothetical protein